MLVGSIIAVLVIARLSWPEFHPAAAPLRPANSGMAPSAAAMPSTAVPATAAVKAPPGGGTAMCGMGIVSLDATDPFAAYRVLETATKKTGERWLSNLLNSDDIRARASGLLLEGKIAQSNLTMQTMSEQSRDALVQLAVGAGDPAIYALALFACGTYSQPASGACQQLSLRAFAQLDPDNAVPWLLLAGNARRRNDAAAEANAFGHAARAQRVDGYNDSLYAFAEPETPKDATPLEQWYLATEIIGIGTAFRMPQSTVASQYCTTDAMLDSAIRDQCNALAELMVTKGPTLLDFGLGGRLGARVGWPAKRVESMSLQVDALNQAFGQAAPTDPMDLWSCSGVARGNAFVRVRAQLGELGAARDVLEHSGESVQELAQQYRNHLATLGRDAQRHAQESNGERSETEN